MARSSYELMRHMDGGLQGMREYKIAFATHSRAAAFVSPEQPVSSFEYLTTLPSEHTSAVRLAKCTESCSEKITGCMRSWWCSWNMLRNRRRSEGRAPMNLRKNWQSGKVARDHGRWPSSPRRRVSLPYRRKPNLALLHRSNGHCHRACSS